MKTIASILVVDDNKGLCDGVKEYLEQEDYAVGCANNGKDAIALLRNNIYDIALVDIELPDIHGTDLVKKLNLQLKQCVMNKSYLMRLSH